MDGRKAAVVAHELQEPFDGILAQHYRLYQADGPSRSYYRSSLPDMERAIVPGGNDGSDLRSSLTEVLALAAMGQGSSTAVMVDIGLAPLNLSSAYIRYSTTTMFCGQD